MKKIHARGTSKHIRFSSYARCRLETVSAAKPTGGLPPVMRQQNHRITPRCTPGAIVSRRVCLSRRARSSIQLSLRARPRTSSGGNDGVFAAATSRLCPLAVQPGRGLLSPVSCPPAALFKRAGRNQMHPVVVLQLCNNPLVPWGQRVTDTRRQWRRRGWIVRFHRDGS